MTTSTVIYETKRDLDPAVKGKEKNLIEMIRRHRRMGVMRCNQQWDKAIRNQEFAKGEQYTDVERRASLANPHVPQMTMNEIGPILSTFSGRQMMQRFERAYVARNTDEISQLQGEIMGAIDRSFMQQADADQVESQAFKDGPGIQGISCVRWRYDTLEDASGALVPEDIPIWSMMWDPEARKVNLSDRRWHRFGEWVSKSEIEQRWPAKYAEVQRLGGGSAEWNELKPTRSMRTPWSNTNMASDRYDGSAVEYYDSREHMCWLEYEEWREVAYRYMVNLPMDGMTYPEALANPMAQTLQEIEMDATQLREFKRLQEESGDPVPDEMVAQFPKIQYQYAWVIGDLILETGDIPIGEFTFLFITGERFMVPGRIEFGSMVDRLRDPQRWNNILLSALGRNLMVNPKGLLIYERGLFVNRDKAFQEWARPGGEIEVPRGKLSQGGEPFRFLAGGTSPYASMLESMLGFYREALPRAAGFNPAALGQVGQDIRRISGTVLSNLQDAAMTSNAAAFDAFRSYRRQVGRLVVAFCRTFWGDRPEELAQIVGADLAYGPPDPMTGQPGPLRITPQMFAQDFWKTIAIEDVEPSGDLLEKTWEGLAQHGNLPVLLQPQADTGRPILDSETIVGMMPGLPSSVREKLTAKIRAAQQAMVQQQAQQQQAGANPQEPEGDEGNG